MTMPTQTVIPQLRMTDAVRSLLLAGFHVVVSAGNENSNACLRSPARVPGAIRRWSGAGSANGSRTASACTAGRRSAGVMGVTR